MLKKLMAAVALIIIGIIYYSGAAYAITIGPSRFEVILPPGEVAVADYYVQNETEKPIHVIVEPENWYNDVYYYKNLSIKDWLELDIYEFDLAPKEIKKLKLTIKVPKNVKGEIVSQIFFSSDVISEKNEPAGVRARIGAILYVAIKGTEVLNAEIKNIAVSKVKENEKEKLKIEVTVRNKGNVHLRPAGEVIIENQDKQKLAELELKSGLAVLPGQEQSYSAYWEEPKLNEGKYKVKAAINYGEIFKLEKKASLNKSFIVDKKGEVVLK